MSAPNPSASQFFPTSATGIELFDEFFESGKEESVSPFLKANSRNWGVNLPLKGSFLAAFFLALSYLFSFTPYIALSHFFLLLTYFFAGIPALISSVEDILTLEINIDVLMTLAAFLSILIGSGREGGLLLVLFSFSGAMEGAVRMKAKGAISSLKQLSPSKVFLVRPDGSLAERSVKDVKVGMHIHVKAGQIVPLDGRVVEGNSSINLVHLTGESLPLRCLQGDSVAAGARNLEGALTLEVTQTSSDSTLARIIQLITQAQESKPKLQRWLDRISRSYAITIISLAAFFALSFPFLFSIPFVGHEGSIYRALAFLIAASPCALIIAIPIAYLSAISVCAKQGILLKGGVILDALAKCNTLAMDKTGTLTTGELSCLGMESFGIDPALDVLSLAYAMERSAVHPIAKALVTEAEKKGKIPAGITDFRVIPGYGLEALYQGEKVQIGQPDWVFPSLLESHIPLLKEKIKTFQESGELLTLLSLKGGAVLFRFKDTLRPRIRDTIRALKHRLKFRVLMLTGDHYANAQTIAQEVEITEFYADLKPEDKLASISKLDNLVMVGDGINDAPALARATVGISMGKMGSATAVDASDIIFLQDNIELLEWLIRKSHQVVKIVKQNLTVAAAAILIATLPALLGWIPLWLAVVLHEGGTVLVGLNALRLLQRGNRVSQP